MPQFMHIGGAANPAVIFFGGRNSTPPDVAGVYTYSAVPIGPADATRQVVVMLQFGYTLAMSVSAVTVGGISARKLLEGGYIHIPTGSQECWLAQVPTGTTADVVVTTNRTSASMSIEVCYVYNCGDHEYYKNVLALSPGTSLTFNNVPVKADGGLVVHAGGAGSQSWSESWNGPESVTEDFDAVVFGSNHTLAGARIPRTTADNSTQDLTVTYPTSANIGAMLVSFAPNPGEWGISEILCGFNGADAATAFTDESPIAAVVSFFGNAQLDTAQKKFGTASLLLDGTGDYCSLPDNNRYTIGLNKFTFDMHIRMPALPTGINILFSHYTNTGNQRAVRCYFDGAASPKTINFNVYDSGQAGNLTSYQWSGVAIDTWYHLRFERDATHVRIYIDGVMVAKVADTTNVIDSTSPFYIGANNSSGVTNFFNGWIDEFRFINGFALCGSDAGFTPPVAEYDRS